MNPDQPYVMRVLGALLFAAFTSFAAPAAAQDVMAAAGAYRELQDICERDRGGLWGVSLCGPMLVVDPATRSVWASERAIGLRGTGAGWTGTLPDGVPVANTSVEWEGQRWIMLLAPLADDPIERRVLVAHEAWHRVQLQLGFAASDAANAHLEHPDGRRWLRLEFRALGTALRSRGRARENAARDALLFRTARHAIFPGAAQQESLLDRNEGLAAYTGVRLGAGDNADLYAARVLDDYDSHDSYARAYAYASGIAYGLLLDRARRNWRRDIGPAAPADLLAAFLPSRSGASLSADQAAERYGGAAIAAEERARAEAQRARIQSLRQRYTTEARLELPLQAMQMEFNPNLITPIEGLGSAYEVLTIRDVWGELRATEGALISADFASVVAPNPDSTGLAGPGWTLTVAPGYRLTVAGANGARTIEPVPAPAP